MKEGRYFRCGNKEHMSKACLTCSQPFPSSNTSKNKPQHAKATKVKKVNKKDDEEPETRIGVDQVINFINAMTEEKCKDFLMKVFTLKNF